MTAPSVLDRGYPVDASREPEPWYEHTLNRWRQHSSKFAWEEQLRHAYQAGRHSVQAAETAELRVLPPLPPLAPAALQHDWDTHPGRILHWHELADAES